MAMLIAVAAGGVFVVVVAAMLVLWARRRPALEQIDPQSVELAADPPSSQVRILRSREELAEAIERATTTEQALAAMASRRAARYTRFGGSATGASKTPALADHPGVTPLRGIGDTPAPPVPPTGTADPGI
ncbi:MAG TPA: hypothetical protein VFC33_16290 [Acidimicrobiia bacterium]|nr:hypothetical protein [Acidimicrobiia bacterium]